MQRLATMIVLLAGAAFCQPASAQTAPPLPSSAPSSASSPPVLTPYADLRLRHEFVDQDGLPQDAHATTLRARVGLRLVPAKGFSLVLEGEAIAALDNDLYNDTVNGVTGRPVVADPPGAVLNQAYVRWQGKPGITATAGRQTVGYDNQRWVGSVGFRQNDQTLDALQVTIEPTAGQPFTASYAHAWRVNRVFGPDSPQGIWRDTRIHLARLGVRPAKDHQLTAYAYGLDLPSAPALSSRTIGVRASGAHDLKGGLRGLYAIEHARQSPRGDNPATASHGYWLIEPGVSLGTTSLRIGYERLAGDGRTALQTPLATLHAFNGWADKFLTTPPDGLRDIYVDVAHGIAPTASVLGGAAFRLVYHDYRATRGDRAYGREWNARISYPIMPWLGGTLTAARYEARGFATDTTKLWAQLDARF